MAYPNIAAVSLHMLHCSACSPAERRATQYVPVSHTCMLRDRNRDNWTSSQSNCKFPGSSRSFHSHPPTAARTISCAMDGFLDCVPLFES